MHVHPLDHLMHHAHPPVHERTTPGYLTTSWGGASGDFVKIFDANGDGKVDMDDFKIWFGKVQCTPGKQSP
jgi:hypothetical protein